MVEDDDTLTAEMLEEDVEFAISVLGGLKVAWGRLGNSDRSYWYWLRARIKAEALACEREEADLN